LTYGLIGLFVFLLLIPRVYGKGPADSQKPPESNSLPGYYQFFMKAGKLVRIKPEIQRDQQIEAGKLIPVSMNQTFPDIALPRASGEKLKFRGYVGNKNLVIVSFRSWW
jgi:hypothetical protein